MKAFYYGARSAYLRAQTLLGCLRATPQDRAEIRQILHESNALSYFTRYAYVLDAKVTPAPISDLSSTAGEGKIWQLWFQGVKGAPDIIKSCLDSVKRQLPDHDRVILDGRNIEKYVSLPGYIYDKKSRGQLSNVNFSDVLRACLLAECGGTWMDATVYLTAPPPVLFFQLPLFFFSRTPAQLLGCGHVLGSSWYLRTTNGNILIESVRDLLLEFWKYEPHCRHHYYFHLMLALAVNHSDDCRRCWENMPFFSNVPPHLLQLELFKPFNADRFAQIKGMSPIHKLTFYGGSEFNTKSPGTLYQYLVKQDR